MPIYEYKCSNCNHVFDVIQKISDDPITHCSACSCDTAVRLVSAAGFQLKGTGWYATDFKTKTNKGSASSNSSSEKKSTEKNVSTTTSQKDE